MNLIQKRFIETVTNSNKRIYIKKEDVVLFDNVGNLYCHGIKDPIYTLDSITEPQKKVPETLTQLLRCIKNPEIVLQALIEYATENKVENNNQNSPENSLYLQNSSHNKSAQNFEFNSIECEYIIRDKQEECIVRFFRCEDPLYLNSIQKYEETHNNLLSYFPKEIVNIILDYMNWGSQNNELFNENSYPKETLPEFSFAIVKKGQEISLISSKQKAKTTHNLDTGQSQIFFPEKFNPEINKNQNKTSFELTDLIFEAGLYEVSYSIPTTESEVFQNHVGCNILRIN